LTIEKITEPGAWLPTIASPPAPPAAVSFLATDMALANGLRLPFVRDAEGRVGWVAVGTRLLPRVEEQA
jgi:hypothetical protein